MARFSGNPIKNPLFGNEFIPATDPSTGDDIAFTPLVIVQFCQQNMSVASGSSNGLIDPVSYAKLQALPTEAVLASQLGELGQVAFPIFIAAPTNGTIVIYQHVLSVPWKIQTMQLFVSAGSTNLSLNHNGTPILFAPGGTVCPVTTVSSGQIGADTTPNLTIEPGDTIGLSLSGTTGNCANLVCSVYATAQIS